MERQAPGFSWRCVVFCAAVLVVLIPASQAGRVCQTALAGEEGAPPRPLDGDWEDLPYLEPAAEPSRAGPAETGNETVSAEGVPADLAASSLIVYQSYRDGNWEIYLANGDGSNQRRLTSNSASDAYPRLSQGCSRIAFVSNREGNYELYTMKVDGSEVTRLTQSEANEYSPDWSPDNRQIVFNSYSFGQSDIYVMRADGLAQTRLTSDEGYDGMPAWSPDGKRIAFISDRSGSYDVWTMNADGSEQTRIGTQPISQNPAWSPDGSLLLYDADSNYNNWQELRAIELASLTEFLLYDPEVRKTDVWARSWSPDGRYAAFTRISFIQYQGTWYWTEAYLEAKEAGKNPFRLTGNNTDWRPDWQAVDLASPTSRMEALPAYSRNCSLVSWSGSDTGGSGLASFDVQSREMSAGDWSNLEWDTKETSAFFCATPGQRYAFRSRARDDYGNVEAWPAGDGDAQTTMYAWKVNGTVTDNRGTPVSGAVVSTTPEAMLAGPSSSEGSYLAYVGQEAASYLTAWQKAGYGALPPARSAAFPDARRDAVLPPADNVVLDGSFETGGFEPRWDAAGWISPTIVSDAMHTGEYAGLLGCRPRGFAPGANVSSTPERSLYPAIAVDSSGIVHVGWMEGPDGAEEVYYAQRGRDGLWSAPENVSNTPGHSNPPAMVADGQGDLHLLWSDWASGVPDLYYAKRASDGSWTGPQNLSNSSLSSTGGRLAVDGNGTVHVIWGEWPGWWTFDLYYAQQGDEGVWSEPYAIARDLGMTGGTDLVADPEGDVHVIWQGPGEVSGDIVYAKRDRDGTWSEPHNVSGTPGFTQSPQMALDGQGNIHVVWWDQTATKPGIHYARRSRDGTWSTSLKIPGSTATAPELAVDGEGNAHVVWANEYDDEIYHTWREPNGHWAQPANVSNSAGTSVSPGLAVDAEGNIHVVWWDRIGGGGILYYARRGRDGIWTTAQPLAENVGWSASQGLATDERGGIHLLWTDDSPGDFEVYYSGPVPAEASGFSSLRQAVTVPANMQAPTVSFLYQLGGASAVDDTWFRVGVEDGIQATPLMSTTAQAPAWRHAWFDLSPWAGEGITLTFEVHETENRPCAWAILDEVSLGSAHPDVWVVKPSMTAWPGEQVTMILHYGNRGGVVAPGVRITETLPPELIFGGAQPPPAITAPTLVWEVGELAAGCEDRAIVITATVVSTATLGSRLVNEVRVRTTAPELETANNLFQAEVFIGARTYLPVIRRNG